MLTTKDQEQSQNQVVQLYTLLLRALTDLVCEYFYVGVTGLSDNELPGLKHPVSHIETAIAQIKEEIKSIG